MNDVFVLRAGRIYNVLISMRVHFLAALIFGLLPAATFCARADQTQELRYDRDIRPILSDNCFRCHGPEAKSRKAKLRLDVREVALEKEAFVPGKPDESEMIRRLMTANEDDHMPPPAMHKTVTPAQIDLLRRWIAAGAKYEPHWSYAPLVRPPLPIVSNAGWTQGAIDTFILARLEESNMTPSPPADRATLLRRLSLDLTGLPPTPEEVDQFVNDPSPDAYPKQVERLLASPHFGERMAVPWLDAVRFADTVGYHGDQD
jgi:mono/diheme cytochrome c family protein